MQKPIAKVAPAIKSLPTKRGKRQPKQYAVRAVVRGLDILLSIAEGTQPLDLTSISSRTQLHTATVFRLLETLKLRGFVQRDANGMYRIGSRAFEVGSAFLRNVSLWTEAGRIAEQLVEATGETASLGILERGEVLYIAIAHGQAELGIQSVAGTRHPLHCTALGKALLADLPWSEARTLLGPAPLKRLTRKTITNLDALREELREVLRLGYAVDDEERLVGVRCIAAPIREHSGRVVAALSAAGPTTRLVGTHLESIIRQVHLVSQEASANFGHGYAIGAPGRLLASRRS
jgi:DNA-binding IclR family transcriptional regulator